jgi:hypothetical protein
MPAPTFLMNPHADPHLPQTLGTGHTVSSVTRPNVTLRVMLYGAMGCL